MLAKFRRSATEKFRIPLIASGDRRNRPLYYAEASFSINPSAKPESLGLGTADTRKITRDVAMVAITAAHIACLIIVAGCGAQRHELALQGSASLQKIAHGLLQLLDPLRERSLVGRLDGFAHHHRRKQQKPEKKSGIRHVGAPSLAKTRSRRVVRPIARGPRPGIATACRV